MYAIPQKMRSAVSLMSYLDLVHFNTKPKISVTFAFIENRLSTLIALQ